MTDITTLQNRLLETELALRKLRTGVREMRVEFGAIRIAYTEAAAEFMASRHLRLAESLDASPGLGASAILLKQRTRISHRSASPASACSARSTRCSRSWLRSLKRRPAGNAAPRQDCGAICIQL